MARPMGGPRGGERAGYGGQLNRNVKELTEAPMKLSEVCLGGVESWRWDSA